ncbi:MAG TPA: hypothetical protein VF429_03780, partial [Anaerolineae bacterium]
DFPDDHTVVPRIGCNSILRDKFRNCSDLDLVSEGGGIGNREDNCARCGMDRDDMSLHRGSVSCYPDCASACALVPRKRTTHSGLAE